MDYKREVAKLAAKRVVDLQPEVLGVGSGTTVRAFIEELSHLNFKPITVSTSIDTTLMLKRYGFKVLELESVDRVDVSVDGADEVSEDLYLIKGGGAAMLREKVLASISDFRVYIVDPSKVVKRTCDRGVPIPIEVVPSALSAVIRGLDELNVPWKLRESKGKLGPVITDNGNLVIDLGCKEAVEKVDLVERLPGVTVSGLFPPKLVNEVLVGDGRVLKRE